MVKTIFLLGHPVGHSISPIFQQVALDYYDLDVVYKPLDVLPNKLEATINLLRNSEFVGANVTVPYKERVFGLVDEVHDSARIVGAVNTIKNHCGKLIGYNTDADGFVMSLEQTAKFDCVGKTCVVIGAGGSARAVIVGLLKTGIGKIIIFNRTFSRATNLAVTMDPTGGKIEAINLQQVDIFNKYIREADLVVNCTSVGMKGGPGPKTTPVTAEIISSKCLVTDLVYNPECTPLIKEANKAGASVLTGLSMLVYQGAIAFEIWTDKKAPSKQMFTAARFTMSKQTN